MIANYVKARPRHLGHRQCQQQTIFQRELNVKEVL
jgi:hypothetical protein